MSVLNGRGRGDLVARILVETPTRLSKEQKKLLEEFRSTETGDECPASNGFFSRVAGRARAADQPLRRSISSLIANSCANSSAAAWSSKLGSRGVRHSQRNSPSTPIAAERYAQARTRARRLERVECRAIGRSTSRHAPIGVHRRRAETAPTPSRFACPRRSPASRPACRRAGERAAAAFGPLVAATKRHAVIAGQRAHPPRAAVEQAPVRGCSASPATGRRRVPKHVAETARRRAPLRTGRCRR